MMYNGDPYEALYRYDAAQAEAEKMIERTCPLCQVCGEYVTEEHCYCLTSSTDADERFDACVHTTCVRVRPLSVSDKMNELIKYLVEDFCYAETPFKREEER